MDKIRDVYWIANRGCMITIENRCTRVPYGIEDRIMIGYDNMMHIYTISDIENACRSNQIIGIFIKELSKKEYKDKIIPGMSILKCEVIKKY